MNEIQTVIEFLTANSHRNLRQNGRNVDIYRVMRTYLVCVSENRDAGFGGNPRLYFRESPPEKKTTTVILHWFKE